MSGILRTIRDMASTKIWTGDPVWIADVLRAEGVHLVEYPGWQNRGHGEFKDIRGVMVHHTGSDTATAASIANGRPDLAGPLSQLHIARDGTVTVVAVGVAWHAGVGMYPWLPTNMGNWHMIGIECAKRYKSDRTTQDELARRAVFRPGELLRGHQSPAVADIRAHDRAQGVCRSRTREMGPGGHRHGNLARRHPGPHRCRPAQAPTPRPPVPVGVFADVLLFRGSEGPQVAALQRQLGITVDGDFGPETEAAVRAFQRSTPGLKVDGIVGPATAAALRLKVLPPSESLLMADDQAS